MSQLSEAFKVDQNMKYSSNFKKSVVSLGCKMIRLAWWWDSVMADFTSVESLKNNPRKE